MGEDSRIKDAEQHIPSREECFELLKQYHVPDNIIEHSMQVSKVCVFLAKKLNERGFNVNTEAVERAGLLHDIMRVCDIKRMKIDENEKARYSDEYREAWACAREEFKGRHHADVAYEILKEKYPYVAELIRKHRYQVIIDEKDRPKTWEEKIIYYADKRVKHSEIVSLRERTEDASKRNRHMDREGDDEKRKRINKKIEELEKEIFDAIGLKPSQLKEMLEAKKAVIFDYDGVIADSLKFAIEIYRKIGKEMAIPEFERIKDGDFFDADWKNLFERRGKNSDEELKKANRIYAEGLKKAESKIKIFPEIKGVLKELSMNYSIGLVSNNIKERVMSSLGRFGLLDCFDSVVCDEHGFLKPDPTQIMICMKELGVSPENVIFVGDMDADIDAAKSAGIKVIGATYGYHSEHKIAHADFIARSPEEILKIIEEHHL